MLKFPHKLRFPELKKKKKEATLGIGVCKRKACTLQGCFLVGASSSAPTDRLCLQPHTSACPRSGSFSSSPTNYICPESN